MSLTLQGRGTPLCGVLQSRLVLVEQWLQLRGQKFLEPGIYDILPLQQFYRIASLDLAKIRFVNKISQQPLQSFGQGLGDGQRNGEILVFRLAQPALAVAQDDAGTRLRRSVGAAAVQQ